MPSSIHVAAALSIFVFSASAQLISNSSVWGTAYPDFVTALSKMGNYTRILYLMAEADLINTLMQAPTMTLFLPTDDAMSRVSPQYINDLQINHTALIDLLSYHAILNGNLVGFDQNNGYEITYTSSNNKFIRVNRYFPDQLYKVTTAQGVKVVQERIKVANGYVHGIDGIMTPPSGGVVDTVTSRPELSTLASLLTKTVLIAEASNYLHLTLFAPTNAAFAGLGSVALNYLTDPANKQDLIDTLKYHEFPTRTQYTAAMRHSMTFTTAERHGQMVMSLEEGDTTFVNNAKIIEADISCTNGVVHVIDHVLLTPQVSTHIQKSIGGSIG